MSHQKRTVQSILKTDSTEESTTTINFMTPSLVLQGQIAFASPKNRKEAFEEALFILDNDKSLHWLLDQSVGSIYYPDPETVVIVINEGE